MRKPKWIHNRHSWLAFLFVFLVSLILGGVLTVTRPATAAPASLPAPQASGYAGSDSCKACHANIIEVWQNTRHAQAFSSPIFQQDWTKQGSDTTCLACHTTGYDAATGKYVQEGVTCESCHGPFQPGHPEQMMTIQPDAELCSTCHKSTTDEWKASKHASANVQCQACHNPHSQTPKAATVNELCTNCHKDRGSSFTHSTHAESGLECSNCHMYKPPRTTDPIMGLVPTGHTFAVGSEACIGCHQDTVHTRNEIVKLSGEVAESQTVSIDTLQKQVDEQTQKITNLQTQGQARLYTGLIQGGIVGLVVGAVAAWIVSKRIEFFEVEDNG